MYIYISGIEIHFYFSRREVSLNSRRNLYQFRNFLNKCYMSLIIGFHSVLWSEFHNDYYTASPIWSLFHESTSSKNSRNFIGKMLLSVKFSWAISQNFRCEFRPVYYIINYLCLISLFLIFFYDKLTSSLLKIHENLICVSLVRSDKVI